MAKFQPIKSDSELLSTFIHRYEIHQIYMKWFVRIFSYLDRYHVKYQQLESFESFVVTDFRKFIFNPLKDRLYKFFFQLLIQFPLGQKPSTHIFPNHELRKAVQFFREIDSDSFEKMLTERLFQKVLSEKIEVAWLHYRNNYTANVNSNSNNNINSNSSAGSVQILYKEILLQELAWMSKLFPSDFTWIWEKFHRLVLTILPKELIVPVVPVDNNYRAGNLLIQWYLET
jgi:hypothetical protein